MADTDSTVFCKLLRCFLTSTKSKQCFIFQVTLKQQLVLFTFILICVYCGFDVVIDPYMLLVVVLGNIYW